MPGLESFLSNPASIFLIYILAGVVILALYLKHVKTSHSIYLEIEQFLEEQNIYAEKIKSRESYLKNIPARMEKLNIFRKIIEDMSKIEDYYEICSYIVNKVKSIFPCSSAVLLYLVGREGELNLTSSAKPSESSMVIKEKQGDEFDFWVCRYGQDLLVEDTKKDFRFDSDKIVSLKTRSIGSIIESPLFVGQSIQGVLRVESVDKGSFTMDDLRVLSVIADISSVSIDKALILRKTYKLAVHDAMTGLYLRQFFIDRLKEEVKRSLVKNHKFYLLMVDVANFKKINDTYGHIAGDLLLKKIADILREIIGDSGNLVSRFGGEEFLILLVDERMNKAVETAEKIRKTVKKTAVKIRRKNIFCTVSIGISCFPDDGKFFDEIIRIADERMYQAKKKGKDKVCFSG